MLCCVLPSAQNLKITATKQPQPPTTNERMTEQRASFSDAVAAVAASVVSSSSSSSSAAAGAAVAGAPPAQPQDESQSATSSAAADSSDGSTDPGSFQTSGSVLSDVGEPPDIFGDVDTVDIKCKTQGVYGTKRQTVKADRTKDSRGLALMNKRIVSIIPQPETALYFQTVQCLACM